MIEFKSKKPRVSLTLDDKIEITFETDKSFLSDYENIKDTELLITIKEFKKRRSLSQNAYMWVLLGELGKKLSISREELYKTYIKDYGKAEYITMKSNAVDTFINVWERGGLGNFATILRSARNYENLIVVAAYYGSSTYNSTEMAHLIEPIVQDCKDQGISTMTYEDIMSLHNENN